MQHKQRVLILGGTGSIGGAVAHVLKHRGHAVTCLARSNQTQARLKSQGFDTLRGDIRTPDTWVECANRFDAVIHAAATWSDDMAKVDQELTARLLDVFATGNAGKTIIYTDGCWSYGETGDDIATEETRFSPLAEFTLSTKSAQSVKVSTKIRGMVILPAMVFEHDGGVLDAMVADAQNRKSIRVVGHEKVRWPLVHKMDLAMLYALMLERGRAGESYNGSAITSMEVGKIARVIAKRYGAPLHPAPIPVEQTMRERGSWVKGFALDQQMSSQKAMTELGWAPTHTDILAELA